MRRVLVPLLVTSIPAFAQDSNTASEARERVEDRSAEEAENVEEAASTAEDSGGGDSGGGDSGGGDSGGGGSEDFGGSQGGDETDAAPQGAPESYTVQPGDTLWTLSQRFLNNPWYWPKVWSYNPQLDNPNWIRPGTVIRFYPGAAPVVIEKQPEEELEDKFEDVGEGGGFELGKGLQQRIDELAGLDAGARRREFFVPAEKLEDAGQVLNSPEEKVLLADGDRAYVKLKKGGPGDTLQVFRKMRELRHPITGSNLGVLVLLTGEVRVDQTGKEQSLSTLTAAWDPVERGDYVGTLPVLTEPVKRQENSKSLKGYVVDAAPRAVSFMGESFVVVVDKGTNDGVQLGNTFNIVRVGDPYTRQYSGMVDEDIGELIVIEASKSVSTCLMVAATREVVPGDRVEMRTK
jgi:LysM domain